MLRASRFRIADDGTNLALYINDLSTPVLTAIYSTVIANKLGLYNREGAGAGSSISAGSIVDVDYIKVVLLLHDDLNESSINTSLWQTDGSLPGIAIRRFFLDPLGSIRLFLFFYVRYM